MTAKQVTGAPQGASKYAEEVARLLELLGGKDNIASALNCVSRVRLVINDMTKVDDKAIGKLPSVRGTIKLPGSQYHVVIGPDVPNYFAAFQNVSGIKPAGSAVELKEAAAKKGGKIQWAMQNFSEIFIPIIPVLVAAGLILGVRNIFEADFGGFVMTQWSPVVKGIDDFLWIPAQAGLWFLPVYISWSIFKKMGGSQVIGILLGLSMLIDPLQNVYAVSGSGNGVQWIWNLDLSKIGFDFGQWKFPWKIAYTAQVIPAMGVAFAAVYIERFMNKWTTPTLRQIVVPLVTVLIGYTLALCAIGPVGWTIGTAISFGVNWALTNEIARYIFAPIFGFFYAPLVVTGLHHMLNAVMAQEVAQNGGTIFFPILCMSNIAQGAACGFFGLMNKKNTKVQSITSSSTASAWLGVTEPAMYGINTRFGAPFVGAIVGSAIGSLFIVAFGVSAAGIGNGAWLGALSVQVASPIAGFSTVGNVGQAWFVIGGLIAVATACTLTYFLRRIPRFKKMESTNAIEDYAKTDMVVKARIDWSDVLVRWFPGLSGVLIFALGFALVVNPAFSADVANGVPGQSFGFVIGAIVMLLSLPLMFSSIIYNRFFSNLTTSWRVRGTGTAAIVVSKRTLFMSFLLLFAFAVLLLAICGVAVAYTAF